MVSTYIGMHSMPTLHLGGYINANPYLGWFVQLRGEADIREVNAVGVTNLDLGRYAWLGGTLRASFFLFPFDMNVNPLLRNRLSFIGEANWFTDANTGRNIHKYVATAKYNISEQGNLVDPGGVIAQYGQVRRWWAWNQKILVKLAYAY